MAKFYVGSKWCYKMTFALGRFWRNTISNYDVFVCDLYAIIGVVGSP